MLTGPPVIVVPLPCPDAGVCSALSLPRLFCQCPALALDEASLSTARTLDRNHCHVCGSIFAAASKQIPRASCPPGRIRRLYSCLNTSRQVISHGRVRDRRRL